MHDTFLNSKILEKIDSKLLEQKNKPGLYVVATPIGNILDISFRAIGILQQADYIFAEDTRQSRKLLDWYNIKTKLISCNEYNETDNTSVIKNDNIYALISDAGTPAISDPGYKIVNWCLKNNIDVFPIPGACSFVAAMSASGMPSDRFSFFGFLPSKEKSRREFLTKLKNIIGTMIFFESPNRISNTLEDMLEIFGDRVCCVCRELTKIFEEFRRGNLSELLQYFEVNNPVGEFIILVSGDNKKIINENDEEILKELQNLLEKKSVKEASQFISEKYQISKNAVYKKALELKNSFVES